MRRAAPEIHPAGARHPEPAGGPIGGAAALLDTLRVLPEIAENTAAMAKATRTLPGIEKKLADIEAAVVQMDGRMANIEAAMPVLREVETTLEQLRLEMAPLKDVGPAGEEDPRRQPR